jgi:hypothetical protein
VEVVWGAPDWFEWLDRRRFHYSLVVLADGETADAFDPLLRRTQPQATRIDARHVALPRATGAADVSVPARAVLVDLMAALGVAPPPGLAAVGG